MEIPVQMHCSLSQTTCHPFQIHKVVRHLETFHLLCHLEVYGQSVILPDHQTPGHNDHHPAFADVEVKWNLHAQHILD